MILGDICTRSCAFCNIKTGKPLPPDRDEPQRLAQNAQLMKLRYLTLTSVDRDDLPDQGAQHWYETIQAVKSLSPSIKVEALVPDFQGNTELLD